MKLYNFPFGPYPQRANIYVAEKGLIDIEVILLDEPGSQSWPPKQIQGLTPAGSLPILVDDDGTVVGQSLVILEYLEDKFADTDLRGPTLAARAHTRQIVVALDEAMTFFGLWARHGSHLGRGVAQTSMEVAQICSARYFRQLRLIEKMMADTPFIAGSDVTIADCVAMATLQYAADFYEVPIPQDCPKLAQWYTGFSRRPSAVSPIYPQARRSLGAGLMQQTGIFL